MVDTEAISRSCLSIGYFFFLSWKAVHTFFLPHTFIPRAYSDASATPRLLVSCLFLITSNQRFCACETPILGQGSGGIGRDRVVKRKMPVSFTPNPMNYNCLLHLGEG